MLEKVEILSYSEHKKKPEFSISHDSTLLDFEYVTVETL